MQRQPTLAEILADDTGKIRAEIADLLLEPDVRRIQAIRQVPAHRPPRGSGLVVAGAIVLLICFVIAGLSGFKPGRADKVETVHEEAALQPAAAPASIPDVEAKEQDQAIEDDDQNQSAEAKDSVRPAEETLYWTGKTGHAIANRTPILTGPGIQGDVIRTANQGESLPVYSFSDGWYKVALPNNAVGYIFGAHFISHDIDTFPYRMALLRDRNIWFLVKEEGYEYHLRVILPNGDSSQWIRRDEVLLDRDINQ